MAKKEKHKTVYARLGDEQTPFDWFWDTFVIPLCPLVLLVIARGLSGQAAPVQHPGEDWWNAELPFTTMVTWMLVNRELVPLMDRALSGVAMFAKWAKGCETYAAFTLAVYYGDTNRVWKLETPARARQVLMGADILLLLFGIVLAWAARKARRREQS